MSGLACATCFKFLRVTKVGVVFEEGRPIRMPMIPAYNLVLATKPTASSAKFGGVSFRSSAATSGRFEPV